MIYQLFPTQIFHESLFRPNHKLIKDLSYEALRLSQVDEDGLEWSSKNYSNGYTSYGSLDQLHLFSTSFEDLKKNIDQSVKKFIKTLEMDIHPNELSMSKCWVNVMSEGCHHTMHMHPLSVISGSFYVSIPKEVKPAVLGKTPTKNSSNFSIKFEDPRMDQFMATPTRKLQAKQKNQRFFELAPKPGDVVLFESWTRHEVPSFTSKEKRISISFNYDWK